MLEFETEELSGQLVAYSQTAPFKSYWIDEGAWTYLQVVQGDRAGANLGQRMTFNTLEEAIESANSLEVGDAFETKIAVLVDALNDAVAGYKYIEQTHGRLYGVGFDRIYDKAKSAGLDI